MARKIALHHDEQALRACFYLLITGILKCCEPCKSGVRLKFDDGHSAFSAEVWALGSGSSIWFASGVLAIQMMRMDLDVFRFLLGSEVPEYRCALSPKSDFPKILRSRPRSRD